MTGPLQNEAQQPRRAVLAILAVTFLWGGSFVWMDQALGATRAEFGVDAEPLGIGLIVLLRFGISAMVLPLVLPAARRGLDAAVWRGGAALGVLLLIGFYLQLFGLRGVTPAVSAFLTSLYVLFVALIGIVVHRRGLGRPLLFGALLATAGAAFISGRLSSSSASPSGSRCSARWSSPSTSS